MQKHTEIPVLINTEMVPAVVRDVFRRIGEVEHNEQELWRVVVARAVLDAYGITKLRSPKEHREAMVDAIVWFLQGDDKAAEVGGLGPCDICDLAGLDGFTIVNAIKKDAETLHEKLKETTES